MSAAHKQTRQQLDELDSLLQRMLSVPMSSLEPEISLERLRPDEFAPLPPTLLGASVQPNPVSRSSGGQAIHSWRLETPDPANPPLAMPVEAAMETAFHGVAPAHAPASAPYPYSMVFGKPLPSEPVPVYSRPTSPMPRMSAPVGIPTPLWQQAPRSIDEPLPVILWPLHILNRFFDVLTFLLGPLGSRLRKPAGRNTLGWLGILMILGAIGWGVADWYGIDWTR